MSANQNIRIFISSPSDVRPERLKAEQIIARLDHEFAFHFRAEAVLWERRPLVVSSHFQDVQNIPTPSSCDIVVVILWSRLGVPLPEDKFRGRISGRPVTGTEWEFEDALASVRERGVPELLLYSKTARISADLGDELALEELRTQRALAQDFLARWVLSGSKSEYAAAFHEFASTAEFEQQLYDHLRALLERRVVAGNDGAVVRWHDAPFRALLSYEYEHSSVFFGRTKARNELRELLAHQIVHGKAFVLVLGASGSGKSSLVKAGLLPDLTLLGMIARVGLVRRAVMRPSDLGGDCVYALAASILSSSALPELLGLECTAEQLADVLRVAPTQVALPIRQAIAAAARTANLADTAEARLVVVVDQLEEMFTAGRSGEHDREAFVAALDALAGTGVVWVVATMRSDFFDRLETMPTLALLSAEGRYLLLPPDAAEVGQIIRGPALEAGLKFQYDARRGLSLDEVIQQVAIGDHRALPLLSFVLDQLWQQRDASQLTFVAYDRLGGLEGALGQRAEEVFAAQPAAVQEALPQLLRAVVTASADPEATISGRPAVLDQFPEGGIAQRLIAAFLAPEGRLLVADEGKAGIATIRVAHEALLTHWERARSHILQDRDDLRIRAAIETAEIEWQNAGTREKRTYILRDPLLARAHDLANRWGDELAPGLRAFIASSQAATQAAIRRRRLLVVTIMLALAGLGTASLSALLIAEKQRNGALIAQSHFLARDSLAATEAGDPALGQLLALEALPRDLRHPDRPFLIQAEGALEDAVVNRREQFVFRGHDDAVRVAIFSPDGKELLTGSDDGSARLWDALTGRPIGELRGHKAGITRLAFSPDGKEIITGSKDGAARLWAAEDGALIHELLGHEKEVLSVAFAPDGKSVATTSDDNTARTWDVRSGENLVIFHGHDDAVVSAQFSPDGQALLTASDDGTARLWDTKTGQVLNVLRGHEDVVNAAVFSPDAKTVATASRDTTARLWDTVTGETLLILRGHQDAIYGAAFSPDGKSLATASKDGTARVWDTATGASSLVLRGHEDSVLSVEFSPDGRSLVTASSDQTARLWSARTGVVTAVLRGHTGSVVEATFSRDGNSVLTSSDDKTARLWGSTPNATYAIINGHTSTVARGMFSPDGNRVLTASLDGTAKIWDAISGIELTSFRGHTAGVNFAAFSPDGKQVITLSMDHTSRLWNADTGAPRFLFDGHDSILNFATFSPDGKQIAITVGPTVQLWDTDTGALLRTFRGHEGIIQSVTFSPKGHRIVTASTDRTARVWDVATGTIITVLRGHGEWLSMAAFSPDGDRVVTASGDSTARLWDVGSGVSLAQLRGHAEPIWFVAFSHDGEKIVTASRDQTVRLWDGKTGMPVSLLRGHDGAVSFAAFSPDDKQLLTTSQDHTARLWDVATGAPLATLRGHGGWVLSGGFSPDSRRIVTTSEDQTARLWLLPPRCQGLIDASRERLPRALSADERKQHFLEQTKADSSIGVYVLIRPIIAWLLPSAGDRCE